MVSGNLQLVDASGDAGPDVVLTLPHKLAEVCQPGLGLSSKLGRSLARRE